LTIGTPSSGPRPRDAPSVTLEISIAPRDLRHLRETLPHQLRQWAGQVGEIVCTVDLERTPGEVGLGTEHERQLLEFVEDCLSPYPHGRLEVADYSPAKRSAVAEKFFGGQPVPAKTARAGPFYAYFFGLDAARCEYVFHLDCDVLFGGGSQTWASEAVELLRQRPDVLLCGPLPGPPRVDGTIEQAAEREPQASPAFAFQTVTSRRFLIDLKRLREQVGPLSVRRHTPRRTRVPLSLWLKGWRRMQLRDRLRPLTLSTLPYDLPERLLGEAMTEAGLRRVDFLGSPPGMWSLHPPDRSERFYESLPRLIERIENGDVSDDQRGNYDVVDSMLA
jgi:hypothetical protein